MDSNPLGVRDEHYPLTLEVTRGIDEALQAAILSAVAELPFMGSFELEASGWMHPTSPTSRLLAEVHIANLPLWPRKPGLAVMAGGWSQGVFEQPMTSVFFEPSTGKRDEVRNPAVISRTVVLPESPEVAQVVQAVLEWLSEFGPGRPSDADRYRKLRNRVEQLIREVHLRVLENDALLETLDERDALVQQLRAQVDHLEAELRRRELSGARVGLPVALIKYLLGPLAIAGAGGYIGVKAAEPTPAPPPHVVVIDDSADQLRVVRSVCDQVLNELREEADNED